MIRKQSSPRTRQPGDHRNAIATVELAIILPILFTLIFGTLEICHRLLLKQTATVAAYETARSAARRTTNQEEARGRGIQIMEDRGIVGATITFRPAEIDELTVGEEFRVQVRVPLRNNTPVNYVLPVGGRLLVRSYMLRE